MVGVVPYLIRAYCNWIEDLNLTPHVLVDSEKTGVVVPKGLAKEGRIILNISSSATENRLITNNSISFKARFSGKSQKVVIPCEAVLSIYAHESGEGMFFDNKLETKEDENTGPNLTIID